MRFNIHLSLSKKQLLQSLSEQSCFDLEKCSVMGLNLLKPELD